MSGIEKKQVFVGRGKRRSGPKSLLVDAEMPLANGSNSNQAGKSAESVPEIVVAPDPAVLMDVPVRVLTDLEKEHLTETLDRLAHLRFRDNAPGCWARQDILVICYDGYDGYDMSDPAGFTFTCDMDTLAPEKVFALDHYAFVTQGQPRLS